ncbi:MAG: hypothetical protein ACPG7F_09610 [Aggregatilineales bacterium]
MDKPTFKDDELNAMLEDVEFMISIHERLPDGWDGIVSKVGLLKYFERLWEQNGYGNNDDE